MSEENFARSHVAQDKILLKLYKGENILKENFIKQITLLNRPSWKCI